MFFFTFQKGGRGTGAIAGCLPGSTVWRRIWKGKPNCQCVLPWPRTKEDLRVFFFGRHGIYFFWGRCQFLKMNNLRGKEVILKDDSKWGLELTARIGYGNDRIFPPVWHFRVDDLPAFPTWDTVDGRNPAPPGMYKTIVNNKINYHIKWCRISEPSTVC